MKLRRRGAFDFPVLSVAAAVKVATDGTIEDARLVLGAIASCPLEVTEAARSLIGSALTDRAIQQAAELAARPARPMVNTDFSLLWRKRVTREYAARALVQLNDDSAT